MIKHFIDGRGGYATDVPSDLMADNELLTASNVQWRAGMKKRAGISKYQASDWSGYLYEAGATPRGGIRAYINGSWTEVESFSTIHSDWDAVLDSMERTHLVYTYEKNWDEVPTLRYASCFNGTWDVNTTLLAEAPTDGLWASVDESDDLQIVWLENSLTDFWGYYPYPYTMKCIAGHWTPKEQIVGLSEEWWYQGQLHMINAQQSHFLLEENVGLATQLVHYQLGPSYYSETHGTNVTGADRANILTTSYPQMIVYYQISAFGVTSVLMIGVLVFFPLLFRVLRASFRRIFTL